MSDIVPGGISSTNAPDGGSTGSDAPAFVPLKVGEATVYVQQVGEAALITPSDGIYPAAAPSPAEAFETAGEILRECVRVMGERLETIGEKVRPQEIHVEFTLTFKATAKHALIPVFVTAEHGFDTGLKVTAVWKRD